MGGHNRPTLSQRWVGVDGEQIFARDARDWQKRREAKFRKPWTSDPSSSRSAILPVLIMS